MRKRVKPQAKFNAYKSYSKESKYEENVGKKVTNANKSDTSHRTRI